MTRVSFPSVLLSVLFLALQGGCVSLTDNADDAYSALLSLGSLDELSINALRSRPYRTEIRDAGVRHCPSVGQFAESRIMAYRSDGLQVYARIDVPTSPAPADGYPVLLFAHGWVGQEAAPEYEFACNEGSVYGPLIRAYLEAGYITVVPGFRGHGTVDGQTAEGAEWLATFDNGSYLSPVFYTIDVLNLLSGIHRIPSGTTVGEALPVNREEVFLAGHSQGGDVVLMALAAMGEDAPSGLQVGGASVWAGTFIDRFTQLETYAPMETAAMAFLSGDGTWTGTALGASGAINPEFVFGHPPDWIGSPHPDQWDWQLDVWNLESVETALGGKLDEMYTTVNERVGDISGASFQIKRTASGALIVEHDGRLAEAYLRIGGSRFPQFLTEPLNLHTSDRDFYSFPDWNEELCGSVNAALGDCESFIYPGNTHSLHLSDQPWFSPPGSQPGFDLMIERDLRRFSGSE